MGDSDGKSPTTIGFLSIFEHPQLGLVGGYLILNAAGRPVEFHCTAPVKPSRAQQILYGPTLQPFLYGEQIGQTLLAKGAARPIAVCTNVALALSVRPFADSPVALVLTQVSAAAPSASPPIADSLATPDDRRADDRRADDARLATSAGAVPEAACATRIWRSDRAHALGENLNTFHLGRNHLAVLADPPGDRAALERSLAALGDFDLSEPFERIHDAVEEAHKAGRA